MTTLLAFLFLVCPVHADTVTEININHDRIETLKNAADTTANSFIYKELERRTRELNDRIDNLEHPHDMKKNMMKTIGYTSSSIGLVSSIWGIYEKSLSLKNSATELAIRLKTQTSIATEIEALQIAEQSPAVAELLTRKLANLAELNEKIENIQLRIRISRLGWYRGVFKGVTSVGLFVLTFFIDDIANWIERKMPKKHIALNFLYGWNRIVYEAGIFSYDTKHMTPEEKSLFYVADSDTLEIPIKDWTEALAEYRERDPAGYDSLRRTAQKQIEKKFSTMIMGELGLIDLKMRILNGEKFEPLPPIMEIDGTYVVPPLLVK